MITLVTSAGTAARWWDGYPADSARYLTEWQHVWSQFTGKKPDFLWRGAEYPTATFPMRPSILAGWDEVVRIVLETPGPFVLSGYSQGAVVSCMVWREEILKPSGRLHHRLNDCLAVIAYGNPMRAPGIAYGNTLLWGRPVPGEDDGYTTGGIAGPADLKPEECIFPQGHRWAGKPAVFDFALAGDLFASAPVGDTPWVKETEVGSNETLIYEAVMDFNGTDLFSFAKKIFAFLTLPWTTVWPLFQAIWNGLAFLTAGMNAPHWQYDSRPATAFLERLAKQV